MKRFRFVFVSLPLRFVSCRVAPRGWENRFVSCRTVSRTMHQPISHPANLSFHGRFVSQRFVPQGVGAFSFHGRFVSQRVVSQPCRAISFRVRVV